MIQGVGPSVVRLSGLVAASRNCRIRGGLVGRVLLVRVIATTSPNF